MKKVTSHAAAARAVIGCVRVGVLMTCETAAWPLVVACLRGIGLVMLMVLVGRCS